MKKVAVILTAVGTFTFAGSAQADNCNIGGPGQYQDALIGFYSDTGAPTPGGSVDNLGQAIAAGYYGNTSNAGIDSDAPARGHGVTPSISPGPKVTDGGVVPGASLGYAITCNGPDAVPNVD
jgi:hypothetical protein